jgi:hypothetical protein
MSLKDIRFLVRLDDQPTKLTRALRDAFDNERFTDLSIECSDGVALATHRPIMAVNSRLVAEKYAAAAADKIIVKKVVFTV